MSSAWLCLGGVEVCHFFLKISVKRIFFFFKLFLFNARDVAMIFLWNRHDDPRSNPRRDCVLFLRYYASESCEARYSTFSYKQMVRQKGFFKFVAASGIREKNSGIKLFVVHWKIDFVLQCSWKDLFEEHTSTITYSIANFSCHKFFIIWFCVKAVWRRRSKEIRYNENLTFLFIYNLSSFYK